MSCKITVLDTVCVQTHLVAAVFGKCNFLHGMAVYNAFNKLQVGPYDCDLPVPTAGHREHHFSHSREPFKRILITVTLI